MTNKGTPSWIGVIPGYVFTLYWTWHHPCWCNLVPPESRNIGKQVFVVLDIILTFFQYKVNLVLEWYITLYWKKSNDQYLVLENIATPNTRYAWILMTKTGWKARTKNCHYRVLSFPANSLLVCCACVTHVPIEHVAVRWLIITGMWSASLLVPVDIDFSRRDPSCSNNDKKYLLLIDIQTCI